MTVERTLHHFPLDPFSRQARLALGEKKLSFREQVEKYWERPPGLQALNPSGLTPVLVEADGGETLAVCEAPAVLAHIEERYPDPPLLPASPAGRAEVRRLAHWFDTKFHFEVNGSILHEKMEKRLLGLGSPDPVVLRTGREALKTHLAYMETLLRDRPWLAGERLSFADIAAAGHLSVIDYMGEGMWDGFPAVKSWCAKIKSRPSFRPLLADRQPGLPPAAHYHDLDF